MSSTETSETECTSAPYGSWITPFTAHAIGKDTIGYGTIVTDHGDIYWIETRPAEAGRHVIVRRTKDGVISDVLPREYNARSRVHEYGGGAYTVNNGVIYFTQYDDQQLYRLIPGSKPELLNTRAGLRFAEPVFDKRFERLIVVCEDHRKDDEEPINSIVSLPLDGSNDFRILASGYDFYSQPKISPDGKKLAWVCWKHPNMPWDSSALFIADFGENGALLKPIMVAGQERESIAQPEWAPDGSLYFISDRKNWWNIHQYHNGKIDVVCEMQAEFARAAWHLGYSSYAFISANELLCSYNVRGFWRLGVLDLVTKDLRQVKSDFTDIWWLKIAGSKAVFRGASPQVPQSIVLMDLAAESFTTVASSVAMEIDPDMISVPESVEFSSGVSTAYGLYYRPQNKYYQGLEGEKPPLMVKVHGGPTGIASTMLNLEIQYWTSRGFAVLDLNYRGSIGFGRSYRQMLDGEWGTADVEDAVSAAQFLIDRGEVDKDRLIVAGGSAGGFTVLCCATFTKMFNAGASYYGICDLEAMTRDTHKFESRYLDKLVGPYPKRRDLYRARSAIHHTDKLSIPLIFFQGLEDKIVPPNQTMMMMEAMKKRGLIVACIMFEGEQHGFRRAETIRRALDSELYFYSRIFAFAVPDDIDEIAIVNM